MLVVGSSWQASTGQSTVEATLILKIEPETCVLHYFVIYLKVSRNIERQLELIKKDAIGKHNK